MLASAQRYANLTLYELLRTPLPLAGFDRGSDHYAESESGLITMQSLAGMSAVPDFPLEAAAYLPPSVLMSSCTDLTVPWWVPV